MCGAVLASGACDTTKENLFPSPDSNGNDPLAMVRAAILGLGVTFLAVPDVAPHLASGALVRLIPCWYADAGAIHLYYSSRTLSPAKISAFVEHVLAHFKGAGLADRFSGGDSGPRPFASS